MKRRLKRFDMNKKPIKPKWYLKIAEIIASPFYLWFNKGRVKVEKEVKALKGPYLILSTHAAFMDFSQIVCGITPKTTGWVITIEEFRRGDWLMRGIGGIPKRRFTRDIATVKHILYYIKKLKHTCTIFPEARFELAGVNEKIDASIGKLCKFADVPVVMCKTNGNFLNSPQWSKHPYRRIRQEAYIYQLLTREQLEQMSVEQVQEIIEKAFVKDEYKWQVENNLHIKCKKRADGIHNILYKCPVCNKEFMMNSLNHELWCENCGSKWEMDTLSRLHGVNTDKGFSHVPDWYNWERAEVRKEVESGQYHFEDEVRVEDYYSSRTGLIPVGNAHFIHDENGFTITGTAYDKPFEIQRPVSTMRSVQIEYNFLKRGQAFHISTDKNTFFMFFKNHKKYATKLHFAVEELYDYQQKKEDNKK